MNFHDEDNLPEVGGVSSSPGQRWLSPRIRWWTGSAKCCPGRLGGNELARWKTKNLAKLISNRRPKRFPPHQRGTGRNDDQRIPGSLLHLAKPQLGHNPIMQQNRSDLQQAATTQRRQRPDCRGPRPRDRPGLPFLLDGRVPGGRGRPSPCWTMPGRAHTERIGAGAPASWTGVQSHARP